MSSNPPATNRKRSSSPKRDAEIAAVPAAIARSSPAAAKAAAAVRDRAAATASAATASTPKQRARRPSSPKATSPRLPAASRPQSATAHLGSHYGVAAKAAAGAPKEGPKAKPKARSSVTAAKSADVNPKTPEKAGVRPTPSTRSPASKAAPSPASKAAPAKSTTRRFEKVVHEASPKAADHGEAQSSTSTAGGIVESTTSGSAYGDSTNALLANPGIGSPLITLVSARDNATKDVHVEAKAATELKANPASPSLAPSTPSPQRMKPVSISLLGTPGSPDAAAGNIKANRQETGSAATPGSIPVLQLSPAAVGEVGVDSRDSSTWALGVEVAAQLAAQALLAPVVIAIPTEGSVVKTGSPTSTVIEADLTSSSVAPEDDVVDDAIVHDLLITATGTGLKVSSPSLTDRDFAVESGGSASKELEAIALEEWSPPRGLANRVQVQASAVVAANRPEVGEPQVLRPASRPPTRLPSLQLPCDSQFTTLETQPAINNQQNDIQQPSPASSQTVRSTLETALPATVADKATSSQVVKPAAADDCPSGHTTPSFDRSVVSSPQKVVVKPPSGELDGPETCAEGGKQGSPEVMDQGIANSSCDYTPSLVTDSSPGTYVVRNRQGQLIVSPSPFQISPPYTVLGPDVTSRRAMQATISFDGSPTKLLEWSPQAGMAKNVGLVDSGAVNPLGSARAKTPSPVSLSPRRVLTPPLRVPSPSLRVLTPLPVFTPPVPGFGGQWQSMPSVGVPTLAGNAINLATGMRDAVTPPQWRTRVCINSVTGQPGSPQLQMAIAAATAAATAAVSPPSVTRGPSGASSRWTLLGPGRHQSGPPRDSSCTPRGSLRAPLSARGSFRAPVAVRSPAVSVQSPVRRSMSCSRADSPVATSRRDSLSSQCPSSVCSVFTCRAGSVPPQLLSRGDGIGVPPAQIGVFPSQAVQVGPRRCATPRMQAPVAIGRFHLANANAGVQFKVL